VKRSILFGTVLTSVVGAAVQLLDSTASER
jgi:hypothetical protein